MENTCLSLNCWLQMKHVVVIPLLLTVRPTDCEPPPLAMFKCVRIWSAKAANEGTRAEQTWHCRSSEELSPVWKRLLSNSWWENFPTLLFACAAMVCAWSKAIDSKRSPHNWQSIFDVVAPGAGLSAPSVLIKVRSMAAGVVECSEERSLAASSFTASSRSSSLLNCLL